MLKVSTNFCPLLLIRSAQIKRLAKIVIAVFKYNSHKKECVSKQTASMPISVENKLFSKQELTGRDSLKGGLYFKTP